jgi:ABC-type uncharacterized transport system involved in gliding motility auxiliary subunit
MQINAMVSITMAVIMVVMINYLAVNHRWRIDLSPDRYYSLSTPTLNMLSRLTAPVKIIVLLNMDHELYSDIKRLLKEYQYASDKIAVEYVDPHRDLGRAKELALKYGVSEPNVIVFQYNERTKIVSEDDVATYDYAPLLSGRPKVLKSFRGELAVSSAIFSIIQDKKPCVYFLAGHGEQRVDDFSQYTGYSMIARLLEKGNIQVKTLNFTDSPSIPKDCSCLIVSGQKKPLSSIEAEVITKYLDNAGRLLLMVDSGIETGLEKTLAVWGIHLGIDRVVGTTLTGRELLVNNYGEHPITEHIKYTTTIMNLPRSVRPLAPTSTLFDKSADKPRLVVLVSSSEDGWAEMSYTQNPPKFDAGIDCPGPIPVAVAIEKGNVPSDVGIKPTRLVITGDSTFINNGSLLAGYSPDLFINSLNWLLERKDAPTFAAKTPAKVSLKIDRQRLHLTYFLTVFIMPLVIILTGVIVSIGRRK